MLSAETSAGAVDEGGSRPPGGRCAWTGSLLDSPASAVDEGGI